MVIRAEMNAKIKFKNREIEIQNIKKCRGIKRYFGLMFRPKSTNALLFEFDKPSRRAIHSFFCPDFLAIWLNNKKIVDFKLVNSKKFSITPKENFTKLLEIPVNERYSRVVAFFLDDKAKI